MLSNPWRLRETAVILLLHQRHLLLETGFTDVYIILRPELCFCLDQKQAGFACAAGNIDRFMQKQAYVDSIHLNNLDKVSKINHGANKIHHLLINYHFDSALS